MRTSDWSSDVCSSDLMAEDDVAFVDQPQRVLEHFVGFGRKARDQVRAKGYIGPRLAHPRAEIDRLPAVVPALHSFQDHVVRSEEHTSELQSLMGISYAVFCLKKNNTILYQNPA